jgi:DNA (cytosine-5)-methyltransferase 1
VTVRGLSLFSNCGAGDVGYRAAGFRFDVMAELVQHRLDVALLNHPRARGVVGDLRTTLPDVVQAWRGRRGDEPPGLLAACPPCQGMSTARGGKGRHDDAEAGSRDSRNLLVDVVADAVEELRPRAVVVENVPAFLTRQVHHPRSGDPVSAAVLLLDRLGDRYRAFPVVTDLADFGVPQTRRRSFLTFIRTGEPGLDVLDEHNLAPYPRPDYAGRHVTIRDALEQASPRALDAASPADSFDADNALHAVPVWDQRRYAMVAAIPPHSGATAWQNSSCLTCGCNVSCDEATTCPNCGDRLPRPTVHDDQGVLRLISGFRRSSYARMRPNEPAATITTASGRIGSDNTLHPWENRVLSAWECAALQTFPVDFRWGDVLRRFGHTHVRAMIGEAVPPMFTQRHGTVLRAVLAGRRPYRAMGRDDRRLAAAREALNRARLASRA